MSAYEEFLANKAKLHAPTGIADLPEINAGLWDFGQAIVRVALRRGRCAIFAGTGLGKTAMQVECAQKVAEHTGGKVLIIAPLAVSAQTIAEAKSRLSYDIVWTDSTKHFESRKEKVGITNYGKIHRFEMSNLSGLCLDESSILKNEDGATRNALVDGCQKIPFRFAFTATPSPNDIQEIGNHAEFLGIMSMAEMLAMFFVHDGGETQKWRLKGHAEEEFYAWMASWCIAVQNPEDLGFDGSRFILPELNMREWIVTSRNPQKDGLFVKSAKTLNERRQARRESIDERSQRALDLIYGADQIQNAKRVFAKILPEQQEEMEEIEGSAGQNKPNEKGEIPNKQGLSGESKSNCKELQLIESRCETQKQASCSQPNIRGIRQANGEAENGMCNLRNKGKEGKALPYGGSLSQNGKDSRNTMRGLQFRIGKIQRRSESFVSCLPVPQTKWVIWCGLNAEQDRLAKLMGDHCVSISGDDNDESKSEKERAWRLGTIPVLLTKGSIFGFGLNWQHCFHTIFFGISDSWEQFYQAIRRFWRFGQKHVVRCHVIISDQEGAVLDNIKRKEADAEKMYQALVANMSEITKGEIEQSRRTVSEYETGSETGEGWKIYLGDCVEVAKYIPDNSIDFSIFSPPFASLYTYSNSDRDMGNCKNDAEFYEHYKFLLAELYRIVKPGRLVSFHCINMPTSKARHGYIGIQDFRGDLIRMMQACGFIYHSEVCIWKDPVVAMQRTKALGLLYKQLRKDSAMSRQGIPDYLVTMRKEGVNPEPVTKCYPHTDGRATDEQKAEALANPEKVFPVDLWQQYASPVWMDIKPGDTLTKGSAREEDDERHICPLQLEVIRRAIKLWTNKGDWVFSPFVGIGSEGYVARQEHRCFIGAELKPSYFRQAIANMHALKQKQEQAKEEELPLQLE